MRMRSIPLGWVLVAWIVVTALIALNRGVDLLWGMALLLLLATVLALILPSLQLRGVRVRRVAFPASAVVGERVTIQYEIEAAGGWPRFGIEIHDALAADEALAPAAFLASVRRRQCHSFSWTPEARGSWQLRDMRIESRYPLGLAKAARRLDACAQEITVYPDLVRLRCLPVRNGAHPRFEQIRSARRGGHDEFFGVRQYSPGDEIRAVHWRASARRDGIVVREFEHRQDRQLWIFLELAAGQHVGQGRDGTLETMIRIAHSIAVKAHEEAIPVGLVCRVADAIQQIPAAADRATYLRIRDALARVSAHAQLPLARWMRRFREQLPVGGTWVMFNLGDPRERAVLERIAAVRAAQAALVEFDTESFAHDPSPTAAVVTQATSRSTLSTVARGADLAQLFGP